MRSRHGMTLVELVIGLVITALATLAGVDTLTTLADRRTAAADALRETVRASAVRRTLRSWLEGIRLIPGDQGRSFELVDRGGSRVPDDELTFVTTAPTVLGAENVIVRLYVDSDPATPERGLTAELRDWSGARTTRVELDSSVTSLDVHCRTELLGTPARWVESWVSPAVLPRGLELRLAGSTALHPLLRVPLTVAFVGGR